MLAKRYRLPVQDFFSKKPGHEKRVPGVTVRFFPTTLSYSRFGVAVSGRIWKSAVARNQVKRTVFLLVDKKRLDKPPADTLVVLTKEARNFSRDDFQRALTAVLRR